MARMTPAPRFPFAPPEPDTMAVTFRLSRDTLYALAQEAKRTAKSRTTLIREFVEAGLAGLPK